VQKVADRFKNQASEDEVSLVLAAVRKASTVIDEVKDSVEKKYWKKTASSQEVRRLGFLRRDRWQRLHRDLRDARDSLRWTLSTMTSFHV
jgi:GTP1/Obg family GTP-binding protein